jgi:hypothetical protein
MPQFDLTQTEIAALIDVLESELKELRGEIADTDRKDFREELKHTEVAVKSVLSKLKAG